MKHKLTVLLEAIGEDDEWEEALVMIRIDEETYRKAETTVKLVLVLM